MLLLETKWMDYNQNLKSSSVIFGKVPVDLKGNRILDGKFEPALK
jgi:hypothetical protein